MTKIEKLKFGFFKNDTALIVAIENRNISGTVLSQKRRRTKRTDLTEPNLFQRRLVFLSEQKIFAVLKPRVYVRPCTKYPTHGIKACVAKQGDTMLDTNTFEIKKFK
ncbi:hypothetical protein BpHYR1_049397 [Brachionus plicatilis]|uniref:Uncharacterized protein n=1 Tax=Brachionus plicatilis TaxID=10195 RepID=A0A3M7RDM4_BRAPC|nr:hypothetical protein BpHYR1_049397 [Brachionus plicatilis]